MVEVGLSNRQLLVNFDNQFEYWLLPDRYLPIRAPGRSPPLPLAGWRDPLPLA